MLSCEADTEIPLGFSRAAAWPDVRRARLRFRKSPGNFARDYTAVTDAAGNGLYIRVCPIENDLIMVDADEMITAPLKPNPCNHQVLDAILGAIEQHRRTVATVRARKLEQRSLAWRLWGIEYDEIIPIDAPEEPDWATMAADIEAVEQEKRELTAVVERVPALLTYFTHVVAGL